MPCVNKSLEAYKELSKQLGDDLAESIVVANKYEIPTLDKAVEMIRGTKIQQFNAAVDHLNTITNPTVDELLSGFSRILTTDGNTISIVKGTNGSEEIVKREVETANLTFIQAINQNFGNIFTLSGTLATNKESLLTTGIIKTPVETENELTAQVGTTVASRAQKEMQDFSEFDLFPSSLPKIEREAAATFPVQFLKSVADQASTKDVVGGVTGNARAGAISYYGEDLVNLAEELFPPIKETTAKKALFSRANPETSNIAAEYKTEKGINSPVGENIYKIDTEKSVKIADAYQAMKDEPTNPEVKAAYQALAKETVDQFDTVTKAGYNIEIYTGEGEPYKSSKAMIDDVIDNKHLFILSTEKEFGTNKITDKQRTDNPLLHDSGRKDVNGVPLLVNDTFRAVHDFFGHTERGNAFGPVGEENAWDVHARMYTDQARRAMTSETRGQNSWVNFGPHLRTTATEADFNKDKVAKDLQKYVKNSEEKKFSNVSDFVKDIFPASIYEKYKSLYDLAKEKKIIINVENGSMSRLAGGLYSPVATWGEGSINIDPSTVYSGLKSWNEFAEVVNHEIIHGLLSRGIQAKNEFELHKKLNPILKSIVDNFDKASENVKETISYIIDTSKDYSRVRDFSKNIADNEDYPSVKNLEELITHAFTNKEFANFLDTIPSSLKSDVKGKETVWSQLKTILRDFINSISGKTALDDINSLMDKYFNVEASTPISNKTELIKKGETGYLDAVNRPYAEQKIGLMPEEFSDIPEAQKVETPASSSITVNEQALADLTERNKDKPQEVVVPSEENQEGQKSFSSLDSYQKVDDPDSYENRRHRTTFTIKNITNMLKTKFGVDVVVVNEPESNWRGKFGADGKVYLNEDKIYSDTPFHEVMHGLMHPLKSEVPELYSSLQKEIANTEEGQRELENVKRLYPELSPDQQVDEAIVSLIGKHAADASLQTKPWYARLLDWIKGVLANMGINTKTFTPDMSLSDVGKLIIDPQFVLNLNKTLRQVAIDERFSKVDDQVSFDRLVEDTLRKLRSDVSIPAKGDADHIRKYWSGKQAEALAQDTRDLNALNSYVISGLSQLKRITDKFEEFKQAYSNKDNKSKEDIDKLANILREIEDTSVIYSNISPLIDSIDKVFEDDEEKSNFTNLRKHIKKQNDLIQGYQIYGENLIADWLMPHMKKTINKALATNNMKGIVTDNIYASVSKSLIAQGITDKRVILEKAVREEIKSTLRTAKQDASSLTQYLGGVLDSRDAVSSLVGQAITEEITKALDKAAEVKHRITKALRKFRGVIPFTTDAKEKEFYQQFMRQADSYEYQGLNEKGEEEYKNVKRWAFHEKYFWDQFYNAKREFQDKLGPAPSRDNEAAYKVWKDKYDKWYKENTVQSVDDKGKPARVPNDTYKNPQHDILMQNDFFKTMYTEYKTANEKLGFQGLKYGIVPQVKSDSIIPTKESIKPRNIIEKARKGIGEKEQIYYAQSIEGYERKTIPVAYTHFLEEHELSFNLANSVSKLAISAHRYEAARGIESHVGVLKNFIGGNSYLKMDARRAYKNTASGLKTLIKGNKNSGIDQPTQEAVKLNKQLDAFLNDVVYGEGLRKETIKGWDAKYLVTNKDGTQEHVHGFENLRQYINQPNLDYAGFEFNKERTIGDYKAKMVVKDWNFSLKKTANNLGILTALQNMAINVNAIIANIGIGKIQYLSEAAGGKYLGLKDAALSEKDYFQALGSGSFFGDLAGGKPSKFGHLGTHYDLIQGELIDSLGKKISPDVAGRLFRKSHLFLGQNAGEHYIQNTLMGAMMRHQQVETNSGEKISLWDAWQKDGNGNWKLRNDIKWGEVEDNAFKQTLSFVNKQLNGNYSKLDKAYAQRSWWGAMLMMFRKHIYNGFANRYRKGYVNYTTGNATEGYYRTFAKGFMREAGDIILNLKFRKLHLTEEEKYATRKLTADLAIFAGLLLAFKGFDDDDNENEFTDELAFVARRLISDNAQYTPVVGTLELAKVVRDPAASVNLVEQYWNFGKQIITDPTGVYEKSGPGYEAGELKWKVKMGRLLPVYRSFINIQEPERLLQFYKQNSIFFLQPDDGKKSNQESESGK